MQQTNNKHLMPTGKLNPAWPFSKQAQKLTGQNGLNEVKHPFFTKLCKHRSN